ncbi:MAG: ABC transporter ATP-binding protein [Myxococcales bacterium]|nr:ABC transporter ATP-binding protein [Myxococcales bacterium]
MADLAATVTASTPDAAPPALRGRGVTVAHGRREALRGVDFDLRYGELLALLGPNGAGKSTLVRAAVGLLRHTGTLLLEGEPLASLDRETRARRIAYVPQQTALRGGLSVAEVVAQGRYAYREGFGGPSPRDRRAIDAALARTDAASLTERTFTRLSHGEQQRVILARALATEARVILLDEPTAALDVAHSLALFALLRTLTAEGFAVLLVSHQLDDARRWADRGLLLDDGRVVAYGPIAEVVAAEPVRAAYGVEMVPNGALGFRAIERSP